MKKQCVSILVSLLLLLTILPVLGEPRLNVSPLFSPQSDDDWPMFRHDASHSGYSSSRAPSTNTVLWNKSVDNVTKASLVSSYGKVYISSYEGNVYCLDAMNGTTLWVSKKVGESLQSDPGIADNKMYISSERFYCFNALSGAELWNTTHGAFSRPPTIVDGKVYLGADAVYCLNAENGTLLWNFTSPGGFFTSPAIADDKVYVGESNENKLYCFSASNGTLLWNLTFNMSISVTPAVAEGRVYLGTWGGQILCINGSNGGYIWESSVADNINSSIAVAYGKIYFGCDDHFVYCFNAVTGGIIWSALTGYRVFSSPLVADEKVFVSSDKFYCFDAENGVELWNYSTGGSISSPAILNGKVYVASNNGNVYCFKNLDYPPETPSTPTGPDAAGVEIPVNFSTVTTDPDGDQLFYLWDWGDGNMSSWLGPFDSNITITTNYSWIDEGNYNIRVKAKDLMGNESHWSDAHTISIGQQININNPKSGNIYLLFPKLNNTFFYSLILDGLGVSIVLTKNDLFIEANTTDAVQRVMFKIVDLKTNETVQVNDTNGSDGFSYHLDVFRGVFELSVFAYDANNNFIDWSIVPFILFFRFNSGSSLRAERLGSLGASLHH
jgi:outer membrane protein assembly factor BamB